VLVTLKGEWSDGTTHLLFEPVELLEKLAVLTPRPRINLLLYHGIFAPHARGRAQAVIRACAEHAPPGRDAPCPECPGQAFQAGTIPPPSAPAASDAAPPCGDNSKARHWTWANLMGRAFDLDVLACPRCGGRMVLIATIEEPLVVRKILRHLGLPTEIPGRAPRVLLQASAICSTPPPDACRRAGCPPGRVLGRRGHARLLSASRPEPPAGACGRDRRRDSHAGEILLDGALVRPVWGY